MVFGRIFFRRKGSRIHVDSRNSDIVQIKGDGLFAILSDVHSPEQDLASVAAISRGIENFKHDKGSFVVMPTGALGLKSLRGQSL